VSILVGAQAVDEVSADGGDVVRGGIDDRRLAVFGEHQQ
jgi:hypothetical protein